MYDLAVIGLGPAGLEICDRAIKNNLKVIAFEKNQIGGTCLNSGCIPTKAILHSVNLYKEMNNCESCGISAQNIDFSWDKINERRKSIVEKFNKALYNNLSKKIEIVSQSAEILLMDEDVLINAQDNIYEAKNIVIATGSIPRELKGFEFNHENILNSDDLLNLDELPKSMVIIGSGAIGLEWAYILSSLGVDVVVIEKEPVLAPQFDIDIQKRIERILKENNIKFVKNAVINSYKDNILKLNSTVNLETDKILVAIGRQPVLPQLHINYPAVECKIISNDDYTTNLDNVYVTGDASNGVMLAHSASYQAGIIIDKILNKESYKFNNIPSVIYLTPEVASVGLKEQDILNKDEYIIKKSMVSSIAKSWCDECPNGIVKVIIKDNKIKGAHVVSKDASMLISIFNILIEKEIDVNEIKNMIFPHPCFSELISGVLKNG